MIETGIESRRSLTMAPRVRRAYRSFLQDGMAKGFAVSQEEAPEDRGTLTQTAFSPEWRNDRLVYGYTQPYAQAQEKGTAPFTPPKQPLIEWGERVASDPGLGMAVWHKIREEGIEAKHYMRSGRRATEEWFQRNSFDRYLTDEF